MRKLYFLFFIPLMITISISCGRSFIYSENSTSDEFVDLGDFDFYTRKLYTIENDDGGRKIVMEKDTLGKKNILLYEVQFLLLKDTSALYITTTPSKYWYDTKDSYIINKYYPNAYYLNNFYFGKVIKNKTTLCLLFKHKKNEQEWVIQKNNDTTLELVEVNLSKLKSDIPVSSFTIKTKNAFIHPFIFDKVPMPFAFGFKEPYEKSDYEGEILKKTYKTDQKNILRTSSILIDFKNLEKKTIRKLLIRFNNNKELSFGRNRVPFYKDFNK